MSKRALRPVSLASIGVLAGLWMTCLYDNGMLAGAAYRLAPAKIDTSSFAHYTPLPRALACTLRLPDRFLAGQVLMIGVHAVDLATETSLFKQYDIGGAVLMDSPANPYDGSIKAFKQGAASHGVPLFLATDEEGGYVQRFANLGVLPAAQDAAATLSTAQAKRLVAKHGLALHQIGIDVVFGPLADVAPASGESPLGNRIFSDSPATVRAYDMAYINGWQAAGILPTLKHFPGLGSATANTDYAQATTPPLSQLKQRDFLPYASGMAATGTAVMVGNQVVPSWSGGPASLSKTVDTYLRGTLGFANNLIVTDSLTATAITDVTTEPQAAVRAIGAGNDIALFVLQDTSEPSNAALLAQLSKAINAALASGTLSKIQLATATAHKLAAQHIDPCTL